MGDSQLMRIQWQIESSIWWNNMKKEQVDELNKLFKEICKDNGQDRWATKA